MAEFTGNAVSSQTGLNEASVNFLRPSVGDACQWRMTGNTEFVCAPLGLLGYFAKKGQVDWILEGSGVHGSGPLFIYFTMALLAGRGSLEIGGA
jgi:hypothetical protein